jgi:ABC-type branched-subunit amino acid transport system substrate-binding protein
MKYRSDRMKLVFVLVAFAMMGWLQSGSGIKAQGGGELSPQEKRGKRIYLKGESEGGEIKAILGSGDLELSAAAFPCANCHGLRGEGSSEGGLQPPQITWSALTSSRQSALTRQNRGPYNETTLARAITFGTNSNGARLHPGMPLYKMTGEQMADLVAYLKRIGEGPDVDSGLNEDTIEVGAALPMTGPLAMIGEDVKQALEAYFKVVNRQGGIYGRKFKLVVADSRGDAAGTAEATRRLVEQSGVFALVGSFEPGDSGATNEFLKQREVPLIGPVTLSPRMPAVPNPYVFYLLPSFADQSRSLVDFIGMSAGQHEARPASRLAVVYANNDLARDALSGVKAEAKIHSMEIVGEHSYNAGRLSPSPIVKLLVEEKPNYVFFFGSGDEFMAFAKEMDGAKLDAGLLGSMVMVGRAALSLPPAVAAKTYLSYPASLPDRDDFAEFISVMKESGVAPRNTGFQAVAYAAAKIFVEAAKSSGRQLDRPDIIRALEQMRNYVTGVIAPVTFGPNRRIGANGSYIVKVDLARKQYVSVSDRVVPKANNQ